MYENGQNQHRRRFRRVNYNTENQTGFKLFSGSTQVRQKRITLQSLWKAKFIAEPQCLRSRPECVLQTKTGWSLTTMEDFQRGFMSKQKKQTHKRETRFMVTRDRHWGKGKSEEGCQKHKLPVIRQTPRDVMYNMSKYDYHYCREPA